MEIYNTLTKKKEELRPVGKGRIGIYVCGPTVYDEPHIGHARSAYVFDVIVRYLRYRGFRVRFVRNVTDIDDKIIERAKEEPGKGELSDKVKVIAKRYLKRYHEDMGLLGLLKPDKEPKATEAIGDIIKFIQILVKKGFAYETPSGVYFDVRRFKDYGKLSCQSLDEMESGVRVALDKSKKDPLDFVLWKNSKAGEPSWRSPWGTGRPGWHIECSVMSTKFLGRYFTIHGGGLDLLFPHHENEIAQTVCAGKKPPRYWLHNGLLTINGQKMSKSLGNFISIKDFISKYKDPDLLKLLFISSHYSHPVDYTEEKVRESARMKERIVLFLHKIEEARKIRNQKSEIKNANQKSKVEKLRKSFQEAMDDDFNTPGALAAIFELVTLGNSFLAHGDLESAVSCGKLIKDLCGVLGLDLKKRQTLDRAFRDEIARLIEERDIARRKRDFKKADRIREILSERGIILEDTKGGTVWREKV